MIACIPTKGRPNTKTWQLFAASNIPFFHFIEPQQLDLYKTTPNCVSIGENDRGIAYVRNFILDWSRANNHPWIVMADDDIHCFGAFLNGKTVNQKNADLFLNIHKIAKTMPYEVVGINYRQWAWAETKELSVNSKLAEVAVLLHVAKITWRYRAEFNLKEDRDFALQTVRNGAGILRFNRYFFSAPDVGTNAGGLQDEYRAKRDQASAIALANYWSPFVTLKKKNGRIDNKIDLKSMAKNFKKQVL